MARRKAPSNESPEERKARRIKEEISNTANRSEKVSWNRKLDALVKLVARIRPIEEEILELHVKKMPIFDEIQELRETMVNECVHPFEYLELDASQEFAICKFCGRNVGVPREFAKKAQD